MRVKTLPLTVAGCVAALLILVFFFFIYRPWQRSWGATDEEIRRPMVGDELVTNPTFDATRAVTIRATPAEIWPWIVQIGYKKAGFYSYDQLDNDGIPSAERLLPEYQDLQVGDRIPMSANVDARVVALEPRRHLLMVFKWGAEDATWAWGLYPADGQTTRLVTRLHVRHERLTSRLVVDAFEIIMMRKCLLGIKRRAESLPHSTDEVPLRSPAESASLFSYSMRAPRSGILVEMEELSRRPTESDLLITFSLSSSLASPTQEEAIEVFGIPGCGIVELAERRGFPYYYYIVNAREETPRGDRLLLLTAVFLNPDLANELNPDIPREQPASQDIPFFGAEDGRRIVNSYYVREKCKISLTKPPANTH